MEIFSIRLREERKINRHTQKKMAELLNVPLRTYQNYEASGKNHREPDYNMLIQISNILCVSIDYLLGKEKL